MEPAIDQHKQNSMIGQPQEWSAEIETHDWSVQIEHSDWSAQIDPCNWSAQMERRNKSKLETGNGSNQFNCRSLLSKISGNISTIEGLRERTE